MDFDKKMHKKCIFIKKTSRKIAKLLKKWPFFRIFLQKTEKKVSFFQTFCKKARPRRKKSPPGDPPRGPPGVSRRTIPRLVIFSLPETGIPIWIWGAKKGDLGGWRGPKRGFRTGF